MALDPRSHALSLTAVFLALGIGILVGTAVLDQDYLVDEQRRVITDLEARFFELKGLANEQSKEIARLSHQLTAQEGFSQAAMQMLVGGVLEGKRVLVIEVDAGMEEALTLHALQIAGASLTSRVCLGAWESRVWKHLVEALVHPSDSTSMTYLEELAASGHRGPFSPPDLAVVCMASSVGSDLRPVEEICMALEASGVKTVVVSQYEADNRLDRLDVSTVDRVDMALGQVAMVFLLEGAQGHYGLGRHAVGLLPERVKAE